MRTLVLAITMTAMGGALAMVAQSPAQIDPPGSTHAKRAGDLPVGKPGPGMVWVDSQKKIYYRQGDKNYGKSKHGAYVSEGDAINMGYVYQNQKPLPNPGPRQE